MLQGAKTKLILTELLVLVLVIGGLAAGHHYFWWFTNAYTPRQTAAAFFNDVAAGNDTAAYGLTSANIHTNVSFADFQNQFSGLKGSHITVDFQSYAGSSKVEIVSGLMTNSKTGHQFNFGMKFPAGSASIDAMNFVPATK